eukprot:67260_1
MPFPLYGAKMPKVIMYSLFGGMGGSQQTQNIKFPYITSVVNHDRQQDFTPQIKRHTSIYSYPIFLLVYLAITFNFATYCTNDLPITNDKLGAVLWQFEYRLVEILIVSHGKQSLI